MAEASGFPRCTVVLHLRGNDAKPDAIILETSSGVREELKRARESESTRAVSVALTMFRRQQSTPALYRISEKRPRARRKPKRSQSTIVGLIRNALRDAGRKDKGKLLQLKNFLGMFRPSTETGDQYVDVDVSQIAPADVKVFWDGTEFTDRDLLEELAQRIAAKRGWQLADYTFSPVISESRDQLDSTRATSQHHETAGRHNLPSLPKQIFGRQPVEKELLKALSNPGVAVIHDIGGSGKTTFALKMAHAAMKNATVCNSVWLDCEKSPSAKVCLSTIHQVFGHAPSTEHENGALSEVVADQIRREPTLILFDNYETVLNDRVVSELLHQLSDISFVLVTTRTIHDGIATAARQLRELSKREACAMFDFYRGANVGTDRALVEKIVERIYRLPLGIELLSKQSRWLGLDQLWTELEAGLAVVSSDDRQLPERQRSLRVCFDLSFSLLSADARDLLHLVAFWSGGIQTEHLSRLVGIEWVNQVKECMHAGLLRQEPRRTEFGFYFSNGGEIREFWVLHPLMRDFLSLHTNASAAASLRYLDQLVSLDGKRDQRARLLYEAGRAELQKMAQVSDYVPDASLSDELDSFWFFHHYPQRGRLDRWSFYEGEKHASDSYKGALKGGVWRFAAFALCFDGIWESPFDKEEYRLREALRLYTKFKDTLGQWRVSNYLVGFHLRNREYEKALENVEQLLDQKNWRKYSSYEDTLALSYFYKAEALYELQMFDETTNALRAFLALESPLPRSGWCSHTQTIRSMMHRTADILIEVGLRGNSSHNWNLADQVLSSRRRCYETSLLHAKLCAVQGQKLRIVEWVYAAACALDYDERLFLDEDILQPLEWLCKISDKSQSVDSATTLLQIAEKCSEFRYFDYAATFCQTALKELQGCRVARLREKIQRALVEITEQASEWERLCVGVAQRDAQPSRGYIVRYRKR